MSAEQSQARLPPEWRTYLAQIVGLWPGLSVPVYEIHQIPPGDLAGWTDADYTVLVEEGRRQIDQQSDDVERIRARAQFLFTTTVALLALVSAGIKAIAKASTPYPLVLWSLAVLAAVLGLLGSAAVVVAKKKLQLVDSALLSQQSSPVLPTLAASYAASVNTGANTVATQVTVFRDAVLLVLLAAMLYAAAWLIAVA